MIPASAGATIVINIYPGGTAPVRVTGPDADMSSTAPQSDVHSPNQAQPSTSGPTQTIDAQMSKLANGIEHVKSLKEKVADKLQRLETLQNELQLQAKQLDMAMKKKLEENKDEG